MSTVKPLMKREKTGRTMKMTKLDAHQLLYAYWTESTDPATHMKVPGLGSNCYFLFIQPAIVNSIEVRALNIPTEHTERIRPDRVVVEAITGPEPKGNVVFDGSLQWEGDKARIQIGDVPAIAASIRCHWKHPINGAYFDLHHPRPWTVPFYVFNYGKTLWNGTYTDMPGFEPPVRPQLKKLKTAPSGTTNLKAWEDGLFVHYESRYFKVSFSLKRPRIAHLSWDVMGSRSLQKNFLMDFRPWQASGPWTLDLGYGTPPLLWGGSVTVEGNKVQYKNLICREGLSLDAEFEVHPKGMNVRMAQRCTTEQTLLEASVWRFVWDGSHVYSLATLAMPLRNCHRNGRTLPSGGWHCTNRGTLTFEPGEGADSLGLQTECSGYAGRRWVSSEFQLGSRPEPYGPVTLLAGAYDAEVRMKLDNIEPVVRGTDRIHVGLQRSWGSGFGFRPEHGGMSNNSFSINCTNCQYFTADLAAYTRTKSPLPDIMELVRYTVEMALKGGPQYGGQFEQAHDGAPSLVISAGRIHQVKPDIKWLKDIWPYLRRPIEYILNAMDETGMYTCKLRSGNSGSYVRSCNAYDTFTFGHHDGLSGALAYRALWNAVALARDAGYQDISRRCGEAAIRLKEAYARSLFNPATGWLAGWRSRDGRLHDHCYAFINAMAVCFGMLDDAQAKQILSRLEAKRIEVGHDDFRYGIAPQLVPVPSEDMHSVPARCDGQWFRPLRSDGQDTFGVFTNGGLTPGVAYFYLHALSKHGFKDTADKICDELLTSFEQGVFEGCLDGRECFTWDGIPSGYEGTLTHDYHVLLAIAQHRGWVEPLEPEWWPA